MFLLYYKSEVTRICGELAENKFIWARVDELSMVTPVLVDLIFVLYEDLYGRIGAQILKLLLSKYRLTAAEIAKATGLTPTAVQRSLVSLVTNRFVLFWKSSNRTYYFGNWKKSYSLLWIGQLVAQAPEIHRQALSEVVLAGVSPESTVVQALKDANFLQQVVEWEFWPETELLASIEGEKQREVQHNPETMGKSEAAKRLQITTDAQRELERIKRSQKQPENGARLYDVNWNRFLVESRRHELVDFTSRMIGSITAQVYEVLLRLSESSIPDTTSVRIPTSETCVTTQQIILGLPESVKAQLASVFITSEDLEDDSSAKRSKLNSGEAAKQSNRLNTPQLVNKHLDLLVESRLAAFVQRVGSRQGGEWFVPFEKLMGDIQQHTFDEIIAQSLGEPAARLIRLIRSTGKLDEKMLANHALLPALEIRHQMSALGFYGFADIQELSRPNERSSSAAAQKRSLFLWYHRPKWAYERLLDLLYAQIRSCITNTQQLRGRHAILLAKLAREDVQSDIDQFLTEREREELAEFKRAEKDLYTTMNMLDRHVRIFRDY